MTAKLTFELDASPIERLEADIAVVAWFADERPIRGVAARADWRLCGRLSKLANEGSASGEAGEAILLTTSGGLRAPLVVALGVGPRADFGLGGIEGLAHDAALRVVDLRAAKLAFPFPEELPGAKGMRRRIAAVVTGIATALAERGAELHVVLAVAPGQVGAISEALATVSLRGAAADVALRIVPRESPAPSRKGSHAAVSRVFSPGPSQVK